MGIKLSVWNKDHDEKWFNLLKTFRTVRGQMGRPQQFVPVETTTEYEYLPSYSGDIYSNSEQYERNKWYATYPL